MTKNNVLYIDFVKSFFSKPRSIRDCKLVLTKFKVPFHSNASDDEIKELVADLFEDEMIKYDLHFKHYPKNLPWYDVK